jgi:hypothetical protein
MDAGQAPEAFALRRSEAGEKHPQAVAQGLIAFRE